LKEKPVTWKEKQQIMQRYNATASGYDELHGEEQQAKYLKALENLHLGGGDAVLDVGCGSGLFFQNVADKSGLVVGVDLSLELLKKANAQAKKSQNTFVVQADADHLPFADDVFDAVFSFTVLQNMPKPPKSLIEWKRIVKHGGLMVVSGLKKAFGLTGFMDVLEASGMQVTGFLNEPNLQCYIAVLKH
jgi:ubiquinone/menaquinone biosynthesis C-methylase UbiE